MRRNVVGVVSERPFDQKGWDVVEWDGSKAFITPVAWHRFFTFQGKRLTVTLMSDNWHLTYELAKEIAIEIWHGKRSYYSYNLNEDKPVWTRHW